MYLYDKRNYDEIIKKKRSMTNCDEWVIEGEETTNGRMCDFYGE